MLNCAISTVHRKGKLKMDLLMEENNKIPIMAKIKYIANLPTTRLVLSTYRT